MKRLLTIFFGLLAATTAMQAANVINNDTFWKTTMVTGNYCLNIQGKVDYTRKVSQTVKSTPVVELKDGLYTLTCYVKTSAAFNELYMSWRWLV